MDCVSVCVWGDEKEGLGTVNIARSRIVRPLTAHGEL